MLRPCHDTSDRAAGRALLLLAVLLTPSCAGREDVRAARDGGPDARLTGDDAGDDASCFPFCGGDPGGGSSVGGSEAGAFADAGTDGPPSCAALQALYEGMETAARACNPQLPNECAATANDPCCPVTVNASDQQSIASFDDAVAQYVMKCTPRCGVRICPPTPSRECDGTSASMGLCR